jgi:two-component system, OmpR family, sensor histidine kinase KdpD
VAGDNTTQLVIRRSAQATWLLPGTGRHSWVTVADVTGSGTTATRLTGGRVTDMPTVAQEPAGGRRRLPTGRSGLPPRRRLAGALTGLIILPLLTLGMNTAARGRLNLASEMLLYLIAVVVVGLIGGLLPALRPRPRP